MQANEIGFSLIDYLETHEINSYEDFLDVIESVSPESVDEDPSNVVFFDLEIDYDNMIVSTLVMRETTGDRSHGVTDSASKSYYNNNGIKIFTVNVQGSFSYTTGSCTTTSVSGSFNPAFLSLWTSTPTISSGNINTRKAYARISGTATCGSNSMNYSLTLTCDDSGHTSSY